MRRLACLLLLAAGARGGEVEALDQDTQLILLELDAEVRARREGGRGEGADALQAEVAALRARAGGAGQPSPSTAPEVHVVRPGKRMFFGERQRIRVRVSVVGRPVILVFVGTRPASWAVEIAPGAQVQRILAGSDQRVRGRVPIEQIDDPALVGAADAAEAEAALEGRLGARVTTFLDWNMFEDEEVLVGPENPRWQAQHVRADALRLYWRATRARRAPLVEEMRAVRLRALYRWREARRLSASFGEWTPLGPLLGRQRRLSEVLADSSAAVEDEERGEIYLLREGVFLRFALPKGPPEVLRLPDTLPQVRGPSALAVDPRRRRLLLATTHDHGYLYALDLGSREWSVINDLDDVDAAGMAFDDLRDSVLCFAYAPDRTLRLHRFSPEEGKHVQETSLPVPPLPEERPLAAACVEGRLVLLYPPSESLLHRAGEDTRAFVVDLQSGRLVLATRVRPWEDFEPLPEAHLERLWSDLTAADAEVALRAMRLLAGQGDAAVRILAKRLAPDPGLPGELDRWVAMLSDDDAFCRDLAQQRLVAAGPEAEDYLARLDLASLPPEARRRVTAALRAVAGPERMRRGVRAVRVLERIETPLAESALRDLVGKGDVSRSAAARDALERIADPHR